MKGYGIVSGTVDFCVDDVLDKINCVIDNSMDLLQNTHIGIVILGERKVILNRQNIFSTFCMKYRQVQLMKMT